MPDPAVVVAMREFKAGLLAREDAQMREMAGQWVQVEAHLAELIELLARDFNERLQDGKSITPAALYKMERYKRLRAQARDEFGQYAEWADGELTRYQDGTVRLGLEHSAQAIQLSYFPDSVGVYFDRLPVEAVINQVGIAGNGRPLGELLRNRMVTQDQDVWQRLVNNLVRGTALGKNPRDVARQMKDDLAGGLNKALVIARTEGLRPYREVSRASYEASGVVTGQKRLAAHDHRTCAACIADDGQVYSIDEVIPDHPQGRCTSVPIVRGMPETTWLAGEDWLRAQDEETQIAILGKAKREAWIDGRFEFKDLVKRTDDPTWGKGLVPRSLADLLKGGRDSFPGADLGGPPSGPRPTSPTEDDLARQIASMRPIMESVIEAGDPEGGGLKSVIDTLEQQLAQERGINQALWDSFGITPDQASSFEWRSLADELETQGRELYDRYTKEGIRSSVAQERGAQVSGYMVVGHEQIQVRQGAFSATAARRMEGEIWRDAKEELHKAQGDLLRRAGFTVQEIARASYEQRQRLLEELGQKELLRTGKGNVSRIDLVPTEAREKTVNLIDFDLAAICYNSAVDPLSLPTLDAYGKMEMADLIRATRITGEDLWQ